MQKGRIETRGSVLLGGAVSLAAAGMLRVDGVLLAMGVGGVLLLALIWCLGWWNLKGLTMDLEGPRVAAAGLPARWRISVLNKRRLLDAFGLNFRVEGPGGMEVDGSVPWVAAGSAADLDFRLEISGRGRGRQMRCLVTSVFPLGMGRFERELLVAFPLVVVPKGVVPVEVLTGGNSRDAMPAGTAILSESAGEPRGLRGYRAGDPAKSIAWPATLRSKARGGGVLVRELDPPGFHPNRAVLVFHSYGKDGVLIRPDRFERAISLLWGAMRHLQAQAIPILVVADFEEWVPRRVVTRRQLGQMGETLAGVVRSKGTEAHELQGRLAEFGPEDGLMVVSDMPLQSWEAQIRRGSNTILVDVSRYESGRRVKGRRPNA